MEEKQKFSVVNTFVSILGLAFMGYLFYMMIASEWGFIYKILLWLLFDGIVSLQVLMLALSIGKRDRNPHVDYNPLINFNIFMLVIYGIGFVGYHVYFIMMIVDVVKGAFTLPM